MDYTIEEFCGKHRAFHTLREWALANCTSMQDAWAKLSPQWLVWVATRPGVLTDQELRLFSVWNSRRFQHLMTDQRSLDALDVAERFAYGKATQTELEDAWGAAAAAVTSNPAAVTAWVAVWPAAAGAAAGAAFAGYTEAQAQWLRENTKPNFSKPLET